VASLVTLLLTSLARADTATTKERARLRQGPSAATELLGEVDAGERVDILGESGGWRQVRTADGRVAYLWAEHLLSREGDARPPEGQGGAPRSVADQVRELRDEVAALRQRPEPATAADLERVRQELDASRPPSATSLAGSTTGSSPVPPSPSAIPRRTARGRTSRCFSWPVRSSASGRAA